MRKTFLSALAVMFTALVLAFTATNEAAAQQNQNCCIYTIDCALVPAACFPLNVCTFWGNGFPPGVVINANGVTNHNLPWPCPPSSMFFGASFCGLFPIAAFNNPVCYNVNGCNLVIRIGFDANGCTRIHIRPC